MQQMSPKPMNVPIPDFRLPQVRIGAVVVLALAAFFIVWLTLRNDNKSAPPKGATNAVAVSVGDLKKVAASVGFPVYWAGARSGTTYELTRTRNGRIYIRYLPSADKVGDTKPNYLTIGTYPRTRAYAELQRAAHQSGTVVRPLPHGGLVLTSRARATGVYFGYPSRHYQVEVYDPSANAAERLVLAGKIVPIK